MKNDEQVPLVYAPEEVQKCLKISRGLLYKGLNSGEIPNIRIGRRFLIPRAALNKLLEGKIPETTGNDDR
jgi:excisionase family DNA binding protein